MQQRYVAPTSDGPEDKLQPINSLSPCLAGRPHDHHTVFAAGVLPGCVVTAAAVAFRFQAEHHWIRNFDWLFCTSTDGPTTYWQEKEVPPIHHHHNNNIHAHSADLLVRSMCWVQATCLCP